MPAPVHRLTLLDLKPGEWGTVLEVTHEAPFSRRLNELGFFAGSSVQCLHMAPFGGDPIAFRIRGSTFALRKQDAQKILIQKCHSTE